MRLHDLEIPETPIADFCQRNKIRKLSLFGSIVRDDFTPASDVDILVEFEPDARTGLAFFGMEIELGEMLGRKVDLNTEGFLSPYYIKAVLREAVPVYVAA